MDTQHGLAASLTRYLTYLAGRNVSDNTRVAYRTDLSQFFTYLMENDITIDRPEKITATNISDFLSHLSDIDLNEGTMLINGKGNKQRTVYLEKKATKALRVYLKDRTSCADQHVFLNYQGGGLSQQGVADIVEKYRIAAGLLRNLAATPSGTPAPHTRQAKATP